MKEAYYKGGVNESYFNKQQYLFEGNKYYVEYSFGCYFIYIDKNNPVSDWLLDKKLFDKYFENKEERRKRIIDESYM